MRQITKDFLKIAVAADPSRNDLVAGLTIYQRFGPSIDAGGVVQVRGGLEVTERDDPFRIHFVDEDNIASVAVTLEEPAASDAGVTTITQLLKHKP